MANYENDIDAVVTKYNITICYRCNCRAKTYELGHSRDHAHTKKRKVCLSREPKSRTSWFTFLHEVGHVVAENASYDNGNNRALAAHNATEWAKAYMRDMRMPIPRKITKEYNAYIREKVARGLRRGLKVVPKELRRY